MKIIRLPALLLYKSLVFTIPLILVLPGDSYCGAWTQKKGRFYFKLSASYLFTKNEFDYRGEKLRIFEERIGFENATFRDFNVSAYFEYGFTDRITFVGRLPFKALTSEWDMFLVQGVFAGSRKVNTVGLADLFLSSRLNILSKPLVVSFQPGIKIPLGYSKRPDNDGAPLGTGEVDLEAQLLIGRSLYPLPAYLTGGIGYRHRKGPLHDEIFYNAEIGLNLDKHLLKVYFEGIHNTSTPPDLAGIPIVTPLPGGGGVFPSVVVGDQHIAKISPSVTFSLSKQLAIQAEVTHILSGTNTITGTAYSFGIVMTN